MDAAPRGDLAQSADQFVSTAACGPWPAFRDEKGVSPAAEIFLRAVYDDASPDELVDLSLEDLVALAHDFWIWRAERKPHEQKVRLTHGKKANGQELDRDILEIAGPDMPFLVDSVMGELGEQGISSLAMFHPVAPAVNGTDQDSLIQIHLPHLAPELAQKVTEQVEATLADVRASVADFAAMRQRMEDCAAELKIARCNASDEDVKEAVALLKWLAAEKFTFLGARDYEYARDKIGAVLADEPVVLAETGLGVLRNPERFVLRKSAEPMLLTPELQRLIAEPTPLIVAKSTLNSRVHRRATADYVGVKRYNKQGDVIGETRFVGLFTSEAFTEPTRNIPMLRRKAEWVLQQAGFPKGGHNYKTLRKIIESYPREELWQIEREDLLRISRGILHLLDRPRARVFLRRDRFNRFVTALAYLPKDRFNTRLREAAGAVIARAYGGEVISFSPQLGEGQLARILYVIGNIDKTRTDPDRTELDNEVAALTRTWEDDFADAIRHSKKFDRSAIHRFDGAFNAAYRERFTVEEALVDAARIVAARDEDTVRVRAYRERGDAANTMRCKFYSRGDVLALSATVPMLENMGLYVESEQNYELKVGAKDVGALPFAVFVHEIETRSTNGAEIDLGIAGKHFEQAFEAVWAGLAENDGYNRLVLKLGAPWREAALIRAFARYRQQSGLDPSPQVQEAALAAHPEMAALFLALFRVRFDPSLPETLKAREEWAKQIEEKVEAALNAVESLDHDRVLRRIAALIAAIRRTNYYQPGADGQPKNYISFKIDSNALVDLPAPKPFREIWVASPQVEGVHLRMGPVARGGLRWSDRRDDFRTEILDLVKAQQVKNAIIVPVGAKGGFYPKKLPLRGAPQYQEAGIEAYKTFLRGLLDLTDNIVDDKVKPPANVVRWDDDDPYLVVAADKGTATFSDIANGISAEYGHWLGDAFASGGSVGYDHKAMGITAKGAWEAVKRHFREIGKDIQKEPFTVIGVGDMSGDVFGNGMLLSHQIRLLAAFDHRDIFIDPNPVDVEASWNERKRLFDKPRSSWADYDKKLISKGGGVFSRTVKSITLTKEIAALTGLKTPQVTPTELMSALLRAPCELLWFGGIGNYVKAKHQPNSDVGDKANDAIRVDGEDVQALVIGEGANLGVTQSGRIAYARKGGRINTDAIDNSAGVDTSDHEVNIKILLADAIRTKALNSEARDELLASMTDEVGALVLKDNYNQTLALSLSQGSAAADLDNHERFMQRLEAAGKLSRAVEGLPSTEEFTALRAAHLGLTRPELSKIIAYAKIDLSDALVASAAPDDAAFEQSLKAYFPVELTKYEASMAHHRLRRDIIATGLADEMVNRCGPTFVQRVSDIARVETVTIASAFEAARRIFGLDDLAARINALDGEAPAAAQMAMHQEIARALMRMTVYLSRHAGFGGASAPSILSVVEDYREPVAKQRATLVQTLGEAEKARVEARRAAFADAGAPAELAQEAALLKPLAAALDVADLARTKNCELGATALVYRVIGVQFGLDALREAAMTLKLSQHWDRLVVRRAAEDLYEDQRRLAEAATIAIGVPPKLAGADWADNAVRTWIGQIGMPAQRARVAFAELDAQGPWSFAKLMLAAAELNALATSLR